MTELAHRLDVALGNPITDSYVDAYIMDDSVFDMEEIDVQVGFEEETDEFSSPKDHQADTSKSSCYQSASSDCSWATSRDVSPVRPGKQTMLEQLDMKPMEDFRDYVNFTPSIPSKLFLQTSANSTSTASGSTSGGSIGGLSPNSSDSGLGIANLRSTSKLFVSQSAVPNDNLSPKKVSYKPLIKTDDVSTSVDLFGGGVPRFRSSICYARSASCDSLF